MIKLVKENNIRIIEEADFLMEMAILSPNRPGLEVVIWSDGNDKSRNKKDKLPRVKIGTDDYEVSVSIEKEPKILAQTKNIKQNEMNKIKEAMKYISKNYDLFLKHYESSYNDFDDNDLFDALRERGDFK